MGGEGGEKKLIFLIFSFQDVKKKANVRGTLMNVWFHLVHGHECTDISAVGSVSAFWLERSTFFTMIFISSWTKNFRVVVSLFFLRAILERNFLIDHPTLLTRFCTGKVWLFFPVPIENCKIQKKKIETGKKMAANEPRSCRVLKGRLGHTSGTLSMHSATCSI